MARKNRQINNRPAEEEQTAPEERDMQTADDDANTGDNFQRGIRQSAPKPTALDELNRQNMRQSLNDMGGMNSMNGMGGTMDPTNALNVLQAPIGREAIKKATDTLNRYKQGKANLENKIVENEQWYKMRHWECINKKKKDQVEPTSGWLLNCILNKHADAMDNYPAPNVLPREEADVGEARMLSDILPVILEMNNFEQTYSDVWDYKLKTGTGVYGVFWDATKNGIGDIQINKVDLLNLFWEPGITDIQKSRNLFHVDLQDNEVLLAKYPQLQGKLTNSTINVAQYVYDDTVDTTDKSAVVDWYYKKVNSQGKQVLHYCKFVNDVVLMATENEQQTELDPMTGMPTGEPMSETGLYDHGRYPFEFDVLFKTEGTPTGFGYIDIGKSSQEYIDRGNQAILQNMFVNARPRYFIRSDGSVKEEEYGDFTKPFVHVDGNLGQDSIVPIVGAGLSGIYVEVINNKIDELKETTGNRDIANGGSTAGVTAASAISSMQEAASRLSRQDSKASYRVFRQICYDVIELIRQFYDLPRQFRIVGANGMQQFVMYDNARLIAQQQGMDFGMDMGVRIPVFDIEVTAEKQSPYSRMAQNELALQLYNMGFFNPQLADQALACIEMMDFPGKDEVMQRIMNNGTMAQQLMMLSQIASNATGDPSIAEGAMMQMGAGPQQGGAIPKMKGKESKSGNAGESSVTANARERNAEAISPT